MDIRYTRCCFGVQIVMLQMIWITSTDALIVVVKDSYCTKHLFPFLTLCFYLYSLSVFCMLIALYPLHLLLKGAAAALVGNMYTIGKFAD